jgi:hypothetical protein
MRRGLTQITSRINQTLFRDLISRPTSH